MNVFNRIPGAAAAMLSLIAASVTMASCTSADDHINTPTIGPSTQAQSSEFTPTAVPTPTPPTDVLFATLSPTDLYGPARFQLVAYSVTGATGSQFSGFDTPVISSNGHDRNAPGHRTMVGFIGHSGDGNASLNYHIPANWAEGSALERIVTRGQPYDGTSEWIGPLSGHLSSQDGERILFMGRYRTEGGEFIDGIFTGDGVNILALAIEGPLSDIGPGMDLRIDQFDAFVAAPHDVVYFNSPVSGDGIWRGNAPGSSSSLLQEGQGLEDLADGWRVTDSDRLILVGATDEHALVMIKNAIWTLGDGTDLEFDSGVWIFTPNENSSEVVAASDSMSDSAGITWRRIYDPTLSGADPAVVGYLADYEEETFDHAIDSGKAVFKWDFKEVKTTRVAKVGDLIDIGSEFADSDRELVSFVSPVVDASGRMVFAASTWTQSMDYIGLVIRESLSGELEVVARTDRLPGSTWLQTFAPQQVTEIATNKFGVAFVTGIGEGLWAEDPAGRLSRVIEKGDQVNISGDMKTVEFIDFAGGNNTTSGRPTGFSDNGDLVFRAQFTDGASAIIYSTFAVE